MNVRKVTNETVLVEIFHGRRCMDIVITDMFFSPKSNFYRIVSFHYILPYICLCLCLFTV